MARPKDSLTGVWHGLYTYALEPAPIYFMATLIEFGTSLSGSTQESERGEHGAPLTLTAMIDGVRAGSAIQFTKAYDGSCGWDHSVAYEGMLNGDGTEIEGRWTIGSQASGRFLMIRSQGADESVVRRSFAKV